MIRCLIALRQFFVNRYFYARGGFADEEKSKSILDNQSLIFTALHTRSCLRTKSKLFS